MARNTAFYELTLFLPIVCMCILVVLGIWMPVSSGETIGFQVTMLLTMIVYLDVLSRKGIDPQTPVNLVPAKGFLYWFLMGIFNFKISSLDALNLHTEPLF